MKQRASIFLLASLLMAGNALAAPVFMLQFGSFESREEADSKLVQLQAKHSGVLAGKDSGIREVSLPPDNLTVYRTQAGPFSTRGEAQSVCAQLASNGDECYVVETAMAPQLSPASTAVAATAPTDGKGAQDRAAAMATASTPAPTRERADAPAGQAPSAAPGTSKSTAKAPAAAAATAASEPPLNVPAVTRWAPTTLRDPQNTAMISRITASNPTAAQAAAPGSASPTPEAPRATASRDAKPAAEAEPSFVGGAGMAASPPSPSLQQALDDAAAEQRAMAPTPPGAKEEGSFWARLNPFAEEAPSPAAAAPASAPRTEPAPVEARDAGAKFPPPTPETVRRAQEEQAREQQQALAKQAEAAAQAQDIPAPRLTPMADAKAPPAPPVPAPSAAPAAAAVPGSKPMLAAAPAMPPQAVPAAAAIPPARVNAEPANRAASAAVPQPVPTPPPPAPTPPPPAPTAALTAASSSAPPNPPTRVIAQAEPLPLPPPPAPLMGRGAVAGAAPAMMATAPMAGAPAPVTPPMATGNVPSPVIVPPPTNMPFQAQAGNANVRVGEAQRVPLSQTMQPPPPPAMGMMQPAPAMALSPSATLGEKTIWAQIGPFADAQTALAYWEQYRSTHPDFPVVRVRVTNNYMALQRGQSQVTLRVGPVMKGAAITNLCQSLPEEPRVQCGRVVDMGIATQLGGPRNGMLPGSRYRR